MEKIIKNKQELNKIPVIINVDFGHTTPIFTFPIGGKCKIKASKEEISIEIEIERK
jgi:muramoyltetrapeptide carboxypeptidase LdcA involved in peptidoglycan recycling